MARRINIVTYACPDRDTWPNNRARKEGLAVVGKSAEWFRARDFRISSEASEGHRVLIIEKPEGDRYSSAPASGPGQSHSSHKRPSSLEATPRRSSSYLHVDTCEKPDS